ncbi:DUF1365 domain-containing protein [Alcanivorax sp. JB21]|uniref:DUF1365 domain-containing protein n=1 Tax=Alcanivorax limicola TaxID=2874102 RepID=UPI001CBEC9D7|nr:DUF1365 domain-containing protein [Alcanivorax limicola]MBZ2189902.1 DUF1365 domain-containing protein [Alcanivorax limicola]
MSLTHIGHGIYQGRVWHERLTPTRHRFAYPLWLMAVDVDDVDGLLGRHRAWGRRWRPIVVRDRDYLDAAAQNSQGSLGGQVRAKAAELGFDWGQGRILMLAQPRIFGWLFNPIVLYWHFPADQAEGQTGTARPDQVIAEVSNTPWHQTHWYPLRLTAQGEDSFTVEDDKAFHVSPFMGMNMRYHWFLQMNDASLTVRIENWQAGEKIFTAGMTLKRQPATREAMGQVIRRFGWQSLRVSAGIYAQAFRLWRKGVPFHGHPEKSEIERR